MDSDRVDDAFRSAVEGMMQDNEPGFRSIWRQAVGDHGRFYAAGLFAVTSAAFVAVYLWQAVVIATLWNWFAADQLGAAQIGVAVAVGLRVLVAILVPRYAREVVTFPQAIWAPSIALGIGWTALQFVS